ncbi:MAG: glycosyltransferase [Thermogemmata sp.]|uniref:Glycosyltransferase n=1 Tax=Thermogemmata fonticola TaxID=2755323 RepID=A0A7V8VBS1_9BACT|nr:glycosyltransferase [Thermogemmata fonticola]MBA2225120.1 glycosyltransferase [Thermogemmata fonticola]MCX8139654.1 glycosyltransferase [Gemmataceae bacterium]GIW84424.1 MAG: glycosyl transferase [Gemmataceae bacterium]
MRVGIALPTLASGDAVGNDALGMGRHLRERGWDVTFFASTVSGVAEPVRRLEEIGRVLCSPEDVLIYHHSIGCETAVRAMERLPLRRKAVKYHNVTPPRFFSQVKRQVADGCREGMEQVPRLARCGAHLWADSEFNAQDIRQCNPQLAVTALPPFHQVEELFHQEPDGRAVIGFDDWTNTFLLVGRLVPNKNVPLAIETLKIFRQRYDDHARLIVAGPWPLPDYVRQVFQYVHDQGQEGHVFVTGSLTVAQLKSLYLISDALLVTSEHEGFCVPLVEAMALRVPAIAVPNAAVPFTGGDAVRYAPADPELLAAELARVVLHDPLEREEQIWRGWQRFTTHFSTEAISRKFDELFDRLLAS